MNFKHKLLSIAASAAIAVSAVTAASALSVDPVKAATKDATASYEWGTLTIGGGGFVSGIVTGQKDMYLRTDVGGAYKYNYETKAWEQLFGFLTDADRGLLSVSGMAIDPTDDNTVYFLCGCAYFSDARTEIIKTTDGGKTFTRVDVTDLIQVHGNGDGRECSEPIAIDPDDPNTIYAGGDVTASTSALIKSTDGGKTWKCVDGYSKAVEYPYTIKWPFWTDHTVKALTTSGEQSYAQQNGIDTIKVLDGKVYVGSSLTGSANVHVASVKDDKFEVLSADLPTANYPVTISDDGAGNLFITYIAGLAFGGNAGGAYKYDIKNGTVKDISPAPNAIGMVVADKKDPKKLVARTCGVWSDQWYAKEWTDNSIAWGDHFFRSTNGGDSWTDITPGQGPMDYSTGTGVKDFISLPIDTNGYAWVYGKACHWGSGILIDPRNPDKVLMTSGNGVFCCDNVWAEKGVQFYFDPKGVEEVVSLDFVSTADGLDLSAIGDYDGYVHESVDKIGIQYNPNMGSTSAIAVCPQNTDVWARTANGDGNNTGSAYYTIDRGKTWTAFKPACTGGKFSITELEKGKYRFINTSTTGAVSYSDDFGATWSNATGINASKGVYTLVDPTDPSIVYASVLTHNDYWSSDMSKKEPTLEESHYAFAISTDYGKTFKETTVCKYDMCDHTGDPAYLSEDTIVMAAGWQGLYKITGKGSKIDKINSVSYAKCVGYGAPKTKGSQNVLYIYGKPEASDPEGIYASEDGGDSWYCINTEHLYGGTGNGNYLVGDLDEYGKVYMSTVGCGIVYGRLTGSAPEPKDPTEPKVTTTAVTTTAVVTTTSTVTTTVSTDKPVTGTTTPVSTTVPPTEEKVTTTQPDDKNDKDDLLYGDVDVNGVVELADVTKLSKHLLSPAAYPLADDQLLARATKQSDVNGDGEVNSLDLSKLMEYNLGNLTLSDLVPKK